MALYRPDILNFSTGSATDSLDYSTWLTNQTVTIRARDIVAVEQMPAGKEFPSDSGSVSKIYLAEGGLTILVRRSRTDILADIAALAPIVGLGTAYVRDEKAVGVDGGTVVSGTWETRDLNTIASDPASVVSSLAANQLTLIAGTYQCWIYTPAHGVARFQTRLRNVTGGSTILIGTSGRTGSLNIASFIHTEFTVAAAQALEVQQWTAANQAGNGMGEAASADAGPEVYCSTRFTRIS